ncbi:MAG TPA: protein-disulfide reductase DsbD [Candidatus Competibacteraceae bacterium]|nr:protein-disulfide reductase DsbD [Candidatus Competibacteraceae bacterium]
MLRRAALLPILLLLPLLALAQSGLFKGWGGSSAGPDLLPPEQAFAPSVSARDARTLEATWAIADGYYLYRDKIKLTLLDAGGLTVQSLELPAGEPKEDEFFGVQQVYYRAARASARLAGDWPAAGEIRVRLDYQGCAEVGVCYPPMNQILPVALPSGATPSTVAASAPALPPSAPAAALPPAEQDRLAQLLARDRLWSLPLFLGLGLLLAFTPCMFPMLPILSGLIVGQGDKLSTPRALALSLTYVLAMALTYTLVGVLAALLGQNLQTLFQHPAVLGGFAGLFVLLALSMFGLFHLQLPARWQQTLTELSNRQIGGRYLGVGVMGALSALIVSPCLAPPLIGILSVIAQSGDVLLGAAALFVLSLGMGLPLLVLGASAGHWLPRAGRWLESIRHLFGYLLLAVALWLLERILPAPLIMLSWAALLLVGAVQLGALHALERPAAGWQVLGKGLGVLLLVYGSLILVGLAGGSRDPWQPLRDVSWSGAAPESAQAAEFQPIKGVAGLQQALAAAGSRPVVLDFYADWCISCKEMERYTFPDPAVRAAWAGALKLRADVSANDAEDQALLKRFGLFGPPAILFFDAQGRERFDHRVVGFLPAPAFAARLQRALDG